MVVAYSIMVVESETHDVRHILKLDFVLQEKRSSGWIEVKLWMVPI